MTHYLKWPHSWTLALYTHLPITFSTHSFWLAAEMSLIRLWTTGWEGISGYYFHAFCIIVWIGLWLASKLYLFPFAWRNHLLGKEVWFGHLFYGQQSFRVENHNSSSEIGFSGHICFCSFVWELIEIRVKPLLWALSWGQTNTYPDKVNLFNMNWLQLNHEPSPLSLSTKYAAWPGKFDIITNMQNK